MPAVKIVDNPAGYPIVEMAIKGKRHLFLIDTGAMGTLLSPELVGHYRPHRGLTTGGVGGDSQTYTVLTNFRALGKTLPEVGHGGDIFDRFSQDMGMKMSGILGQDLLGQFKSFTVDNQAGLFRWEV